MLENILFGYGTLISFIMSVKNMSQEDYDRFVNNVDIFSQERIKNIPRHRMVMLNNAKGGRYLPFNVHGLHKHLKYSKSHPIIRSVYLNVETRRKIEDKYVASLLQDLKDMLSVSTNVSEQNFKKAINKVKFSDQIAKVLLHAHQSGDMTSLNNIVRNVNPEKIAQVTQILRAPYNNQNMNKRKVSKASKAYANEQRMKRDQLLLKQRKYQAEIELNRNKNALGRASTIARKVLIDLERNPSKMEFKFPELGFKMTRRDDTIMMMWYPCSRKRNRTGKVLFAPMSTSISVPIQKMIMTNWGYVPITNVSRNSAVDTVYLVPDILDKVPGSRATVKQMSKAVLLMLKERPITNRNLYNSTSNNNRSSSNNSSDNNRNYDRSSDIAITSIFDDASLEAYPISRGDRVSDIIIRVLNFLRTDGHHQRLRMYVDIVEVDLDGSNDHYSEDIYKYLGDINDIARKLRNTDNTIGNVSRVSKITISGDFVDDIFEQTYSFKINIYPNRPDDMNEYNFFLERI